MTYYNILTLANYISAKLELMKLDLAVSETKGQSVKDSTKKNLLSQINAYEEFCDKYLLQYFPCDNTQLCRFGQHLSTKFQSSDSVGNYLSGIHTCLALLGLQVPDVNDKQMKMFITGLKRAMPHAIKQAEPVTPLLLVRLSKVVNYKDQVELVAWTGLLLGFYLFLRKSNLVPDTMETFNMEEQFCRKDVNLLGPEKAMMIEIRWSKTIQYKQKILRLPVLPANNKAICPVFWLHYMVSKIPAAPLQPVLALHDKGRVVALSANQLIYRLRKWLILVGEEPAAYSLHSLRRGGATFAYQANIEGDMIKLLGDWASDAYKWYIDVSMDKRYDIMKAFVEALNNLCDC